MSSIKLVHYFVIRAKKNLRFTRYTSRPRTSIKPGVRSDHTGRFGLAKIAARLRQSACEEFARLQTLPPANLASSGRTISLFRALSVASISTNSGGRWKAVLQVDQAAPANQDLLRHLRQCRSITQLDCCLCSYLLSPEKACRLPQSLHSILSVTLAFEKVQKTLLYQLLKHRGTSSPS